jgi:hypothetical protein
MSVRVILRNMIVHVTLLLRETKLTQYCNPVPERGEVFCRLEIVHTSSGTHPTN